MTEPTPEQVSAAERLGVSLYFTNAPLTIAKLVELVEQLQYRVAALEEGKRADMRSLWQRRK